MMIKNKINLSALLLTALFSMTSFAGILEDFDSLGGNDVLLDKASALEPEKSITIVQNRIVDRNFRHELSLLGGAALGGDAYVSSFSGGVGYDFHMTPRWSMGARFSYFQNSLRSEGRNLIDQFEYIPDIDWPKYSYTGTLNFYPIYGKFSLFNWSIVHFDVYAMIEGGIVQLKSGSSPTYGAGGGVGMWFSQHLSTKLELKYQNYSVKRQTGDSSLDLTVASLSMGYLF